MKKPYLLILIAATLHSIAFGQQNEPTKEQLKEKYQNSNINNETARKMQKENPYPDSVVLAPLHFVNTFMALDTADFEFKSISCDIDVQTEIPDDYRFYISPFNAAFNNMQFYCGIQTNSDGTPINGGKFTGIGRGCIFSRWMERNKAALKTNGYYASSDSEGDFISVRNKFKWNKGLYRLRLFKSGYVSGKPVPNNFSEKDLFFAWGDYEHSWITMEVEDLASHKKTTIGSLAFPGKKLVFTKTNVIFLEQYGSIINFAKNTSIAGAINYKELPVVKLAIQNFMVNGKKVVPHDVKTFHNRTHHTDQSKIAMPIPLLSTADYDSKTGTIQYTAGALQSWVNPKEE